MSFIKKLGTFSAAVSVAALMVAGTAEAKNFKIAVGDSAGSAQEALGLAFVKALEEKSGGEHTATLFLNGQLGSEQDTVNEAAIGTLDMSLLAINNITPFSPSVGVFTLPYVILSLEDAEKLTQGPIGQELIENTIRDAGVRIIGWTYTGFRRLTNSKKPVKSVADLQDLIIRVPKNEIMIETYKAWGINPTPMAWSETFTGLQTKVVDGQDNPYLTINAMKFYEVQDHVTNLRYIFSIEPLIISEAVFQDLSEEEQQMILEAGQEATQVSAQFLRDSEAAIKEELTAKGMEIIDPENDEAEFIQLATEAVWPQFYESIGGVEKLNAVLEAIGREPVQQ
ncbi:MULTISPECIES: TRAP transporter substrate-binding protein [Ruegeria]|jgi:tripartite ATP-independent transporter DctP family solute receptor|uniref:DctP family TRAP transporter solute-binding subunit n=1 Tax=Ruegeria atlantica TaxID=81569 RepID=A0AA90YVE0_9RHOB|nr:MULTISPECIES: TRAP transporter substrate-binding protein [Ruegeria]NOD30444.1 DctP family TRAP transporter solute-binding subunit [Ruegeria atlantica]NOE20011.1 DctP family TRAP transporter solute-binding subunit [Ruegeria atlantica]NOE27230.1 DctP family TRAP transporter solute-binding subunit [Ruegeria sp. HKCCD6157]QFT75351.1 Sialic acid-binding periplasmic protein SiaP precursor [Ruegeria sp. THAF33]